MENQGERLTVPTSRLIKRHLEPSAIGRIGRIGRIGCPSVRKKMTICMYRFGGCSSKLVADAPQLGDRLSCT